MSAADYQAALTTLDTALKPAVAAVHASPGVAELGVAKDALVAAMTSEVQRLQSLKPPATAEKVHADLIEGLETTLGGVRVADVTTVPPPNSCGIAAPPLPQLTNKVNLPLRGTLLANAVQTAAKAGFTTGSFIPAPLPPPAPPGNRRAPNGKIIERSGPRGDGRLKIINGGADVAVSVVTSDPAKPQVMIYVQRDAQATVTGITGTYQVYFKTGTDWDDTRRAFTEDCTFEKFDEPFDRTSDWEITLSADGASNASTSEVPSF